MNSLLSTNIYEDLLYYNKIFNEVKNDENLEDKIFYFVNHFGTFLHSNREIINMYGNENNPENLNKINEVLKNIYDIISEIKKLLKSEHYAFKWVLGIIYSTSDIIDKYVEIRLEMEE
jgi:hypothetical protein